MFNFCINIYLHSNNIKTIQINFIFIKHLYFIFNIYKIDINYYKLMKIILIK